MRQLSGAIGEYRLQQAEHSPPAFERRFSVARPQTIVCEEILHAPADRREFDSDRVEIGANRGMLSEKLKWPGGFTRTYTPTAA